MRSCLISLSEAKLFHGLWVIFQYILIDVHRYSKKDLLKLSNTISAVFFLDQSKNRNEIMQNMELLIDVLKKIPSDKFNLFKVWVKTIIEDGLPKQAKEDIDRILEKAVPKEVKQMISNVTQVLKKEYEEAVAKGIEKGKLEGKLEDAQKMLAENMSEDLIVKITGLSLEQIRKLKEENKNSLQ